MAKTLAKRFAVGLMASGFKETKPTTHYRVFTDGSVWFYVWHSWCFTLEPDR